MSSKNYFGGAIINSGPDLPLAPLTPEGTLFLKTGATPGLYFYGFNPDTSGSFGNQAAQGWNLLVDTSGVAPYVLKVGDTMTGPLTITPGILPGIVLQSATPGIRFTETDQGLNLKEWLLVADAATFQIQTRDDAFGSPVTQFSLTRGGVLSINGSTVWTAGNDGSGSGLDADLLDGVDSATLRNASLAFTSGVVPIARGGTNTSASPTAGAVIYGSGSSYAVSAAGAATSGSGTGQVWQVLTSGGGGAPVWQNSTSLNVAFATTANTAAAATNASNVPWTGITGLGAFATSSLTFGAFPNATTTTTARPSYYFNMGTAALTMRPTEFPQNSISGWSAYGPSDMGNFQTGLTVVGPSGVYGLQIAANWNVEEGASTGLRYRVNDDTGDTTSWGAFQTLWDSGNFTPTNYVLKSGDTMTGTLAMSGVTGNITLGTGTTLFNSAAGGLFQINGAVVAVGDLRSTTGAITAFVGSVTAGNSGTTGLARLTPGTGGQTGYIEFVGSNTTRAGYIGFAATPGAIDTGILNYVAATHAFTGAITATGNITAFAPSDRRLKDNIVPITDALLKVLSLQGVNYTLKEGGRAETGLIAQDVQAVVPEVVREGSDGIYGIAYGNLVGLLVEAIKEQQREIDELKALMHRVLTRFA